MSFPIDIAWLRQGVVVGIEHSVPADDGALRYSPPSQIDAVLELTAGTAEESGLRVGDTLQYQR